MFASEHTLMSRNQKIDITPETMDVPASIRAFARYMKLSDTAIRKAIDAQKIIKGVDRTGPQPRIIPRIAEHEYRQNFNPVGSNTKVSETQNFGSDGTMNAAKRARAVFQAKLAELDYKERTGELVKRDEVYKALFSYGQRVRDALLAVPDKTIDNILAAKTRNESHLLLLNAISDALEKLSNGDGLNVINPQNVN